MKKKDCDNEFQRCDDEFKRNVEWLQKNISPDEIYIFAQKALMSAQFFLCELINWIDVDEECDIDKIFRAWFNVIQMISQKQENQEDFTINLRLKTRDEL